MLQSTGIKGKETISIDDYITREVNNSKMCDFFEQSLSLHSEILNEAMCCVEELFEGENSIIVQTPDRVNGDLERPNEFGLGEDGAVNKSGNFDGFKNVKEVGSTGGTKLKGLLNKLKEVVDYNKEVSLRYAQQSAERRARILELRRLGGHEGEFADAIISELSDTVTEMRPQLVHYRVLRSRMINTASPILRKRKSKEEYNRTLS